MALAALALLGIALSAAPAPIVSPQPFAFITPGARIDATERRGLDKGKTVVKVLPASDPDVAMFAAVRTAAPPERLIAWTREIAALLQGRYVSAVGRLSDPPRLADLAGVALEDNDLEDLQRCRPGDCGVKLSATEIARLQKQIDGGTDWKPRVQSEFRRLLLDRVLAYLDDGDAALPPYHDDVAPVTADVEFAALMARLGFAMPQLPGVLEYLASYPRVAHPSVVDSFIYWSKETLGMRPIMSMTHVSILRSDASGTPEVFVISKQIFATHYKNASVSVTAVTGSGPSQYLVYVHRSHVDVLQGLAGGLIRRIIERRVRAEAPDVLNGLRMRLERGDPPATY
jgi:hypothetical protein